MKCPLCHKKLVEVNKSGVILKCPSCSWQLLKLGKKEEIEKPISSQKVF